MVPDDIDAVWRGFFELGVGIYIEWHSSLPSTMDAAAALAAEGAFHGFIVGADEQTSGRGRRGATWVSPPGAGLYFSFIAKPTPMSLSLLTLAAGVAVRQGIAAASGLQADLKWPNDLFVGKRKLGGILAEGLGIGTPEQTVIVGVGVNIKRAIYPPEVAMRATSIEEELGRPVDRAEIFGEIVGKLWDCAEKLQRNPSGILQAWRAASPSAVGTRVEWDGHHGVTAGIDEAGALLVKTASGVERIIAGELHWNL